MKYPFSWKKSKDIIQYVTTETKIKSIQINHTQRTIDGLELIRIQLPSEIITALKTGKCVWSVTPITGYPTFFQIENIEDNQLICYIKYEEVGKENSCKVTFFYGE